MFHKKDHKEEKKKKNFFFAIETFLQQSRQLIGWITVVFERGKLDEKRFKDLLTSTIIDKLNECWDTSTKHCHFESSFQFSSDAKVHINNNTTHTTLHIKNVWAWIFCFILIFFIQLTKWELSSLFMLIAMIFFSFFLIFVCFFVFFFAASSASLKCQQTVIRFNLVASIYTTIIVASFVSEPAMCL